MSCGLQCCPPLLRPSFQAADEMKERLAGMLGTEAASRLYAGTFHSFCYRVLKRYISQLEGCGRGSDFAVYDQVGQPARLALWVFSRGAASRQLPANRGLPSGLLAFGLARCRQQHCSAVAAICRT